MLGSKKTALGASHGRRAAIIAATLLSAGAALAQGNTVKIGHLTDMNSAYADLAGKYGVAATEMAIEDFGGSVLGKKIELIVADHQLKPSVGSAIATEWFDRGNVDVITGLTGSSVAMAVQEIARARPKKAVLYTVPQSSDLSGTKCIANAIQWAADFYPLGVSVTRFVTEHGAKKSYVLIPDSASGEPARRAAETGVTAGGGKLLGAVRVPVASGDASSYVLQAQGSGADNLIIGFGGSDMVNVVKAAKEFGLIASGKNVLALGLFTTDVKAMGLATAQGITFSTPFYAGITPEATAWAKRFEARTGTVPAFSHVADYEAVTHYLKAVQAAGTTDATVVIPKMREIPVQGFALANAKILGNNHLIRDMYIGRVKTPAASTSAADYMELLGTVPALEAYQPIKDSECPLVKAGN